MKASFCSYKEALFFIGQGAIILYPTETYYALGCSLFSPRLQEIYHIKQRPYSKILPCIAHSIEQMKTVALVSEQATDILSIFPRISIILPLRVPLQYFQKTIALRLAHTPLLQHLTADSIIISTSANISSYPPVSSYMEIDDELRSHFPLCLPSSDIDKPQGLGPSTIVQLRQDTIHVVREGTISKEELSKQYGVGRVM